MNSHTSFSELCSLICECENTGARLLLDEKGVPSVDNVSLLSPELLARLRKSKEEIRDYLSRCKPELPAEIPFVSRSVEVICLGSDAAGDSLFIFVGENPFYRLTPDVYVWIRYALDSLYPTSPQAAVDALAVVDALGCWVSRYYPPHKIAAAFARRGVLPKAEYKDLPNPKHGTVEDWLNSWMKPNEGTKCDTVSRKKKS